MWPDLKREAPERDALLSLFAASLSNDQAKALLHRGSDILAKARAPAKTGDGWKPGMVMDKPPRTYNAVCITTGRSYAEEHARAAAYYKRPENAEYHVFTDSTGVVREVWVGKVTFKELYEQYVNEEANGDEAQAPIHFTSFYESRPTNFHPRDFESCVCDRCK